MLIAAWFFAKFEDALIVVPHGLFATIEHALDAD